MEILGLDYKNYSMALIVEKTFFTLCFHIFTIWYIEDKASRFTDVIDIDTCLDYRLVQKLAKDN